jgi:hypothetical protein
LFSIKATFLADIPITIRARNVVNTRGEKNLMAVPGAHNHEPATISPPGGEYFVVCKPKPPPSEGSKKASCEKKGPPHKPEKPPGWKPPYFDDKRYMSPERRTQFLESLRNYLARGYQLKYSNIVIQTKDSKYKDNTFADVVGLFNNPGQRYEHKLAELFNIHEAAKDPLDFLNTNLENMPKRDMMGNAWCGVSDEGEPHCRNVNVSPLSLVIRPTNCRFVVEVYDWIDGKVIFRKSYARVKPIYHGNPKYDAYINDIIGDILKHVSRIVDPGKIEERMNSLMAGNGPDQTFFEVVPHGKKSEFTGSWQQLLSQTVYSRTGEGKRRTVNLLENLTLFYKNPQHDRTNTFINIHNPPAGTVVIQGEIDELNMNFASEGMNVIEKKLTQLSKDHFKNFNGATLLDSDTKKEYIVYQDKYGNHISFQNNVYPTIRISPPPAFADHIYRKGDPVYKAFDFDMSPLGMGDYAGILFQKITYPSFSVTHEGETYLIYSDRNSTHRDYQEAVSHLVRTVHECNQEYGLSAPDGVNKIRMAADNQENAYGGHIVIINSGMLKRAISQKHSTTVRHEVAHVIDARYGISKNSKLNMLYDALSATENYRVLSAISESQVYDNGTPDAFGGHAPDNVREVVASSTNFSRSPNWRKIVESFAPLVRLQYYYLLEAHLEALNECLPNPENSTLVALMDEQLKIVRTMLPKDFNKINPVPSESSYLRKLERPVKFVSEPGFDKLQKDIASGKAIVIVYRDHKPNSPFLTALFGNKLPESTQKMERLDSLASQLPADVKFYAIPFKERLSFMDAVGVPHAEESPIPGDPSYDLHYPEHGVLYFNDGKYKRDINVMAADKNALLTNSELLKTSGLEICNAETLVQKSKKSKKPIIAFTYYPNDEDVLNKKMKDHHCQYLYEILPVVKRFKKALEAQFEFVLIPASEAVKVEGYSTENETNFFSVDNGRVRENAYMNLVAPLSEKLNDFLFGGQKHMWLK